MGAGFLLCLSVAVMHCAADASLLRLEVRSLEERRDHPGSLRQSTRRVSWDANETAVVICDMWNQHWCQGATARVGEMAPRMNRVVGELRRRGALIIHCPSDTMAFYQNHPGRRLAQSAPRVETGAKEGWQARDGRREPALPIDDSDGGCDCRPRCKEGNPWRSQIAALEIRDGDAITDSAEAYYLMRQRGITNVIVMGVHQNMCVLGRPFAIRRLVQLGQNVVLMRDMTDSMYNSRQRPAVDHFTGNDLVCWHIERWWCPTITSDQLLGGKAFRFRADTKSPRRYQDFRRFFEAAAGGSSAVSNDR